MAMTSLERERVERRLAAILVADVAGYSRLMGADEEGTHAALTMLRREVTDPEITEHRGRIVKTTGDGLLVEFASVVDAVRCAVELQREMALRNNGVSKESRALALDNNDAKARSWLGWILLISGDYKGALGEIERALGLSPNLGAAHCALGVTLIWSGRPKEGLAALRRYFRLDPRDPSVGAFLSQIAVGHYYSREYEAAVEAAEEAIWSNPDFPLNYFWLPLALGQLGRTGEAREALKKAIAAGPRLFDVYVCQRVTLFRPEDYAHMLEDLRKAGWQG